MPHSFIQNAGNPARGESELLWCIFDPAQVQFHKDLRVIDKCRNKCIDLSAPKSPSQVQFYKDLRVINKCHNKCIDLSAPISLFTQVQFHKDLRVINECLDGLIQNAQATRQEDDSEALQNRDYSKVWVQ